MTAFDGPNNCAENTDREIYREPDKTGLGSFYSDSIHVTKDGGIGINCGGFVRVMPLKEWFALSTPAAKPGDEAVRVTTDDDVLVALIQKHFPDPRKAQLITTRWKDSIDVDRPAFALKQFLSDLVALSASPQAAPEAKRTA